MSRMFSVVLCLGLLAVASPRQLWRNDLPQRIERFPHSSKLKVEIPPADQRNPEKCELYESSHMDEGCRQTCSVSGYFANHRIQERHRRKVSQCRAAGSFCRVHLAHNAEMNVSMTNGRCTTDCRCVPYGESSEILFGIEQAASALVSEVERRRNHHRIRHGMNHYGELKIHVPPRESRNRTGCEEYEQKYYGGSQRDFQCKSVCSVRGSIGRLLFEGKPRVLDGNDREGSYCELRIQGEGKFELRGAEQVVSGRCRRGICRPRDWVEATTPKQRLLNGGSLSDGVIHVSGEAMRNIKEMRNKEVFMQTL